MTSRPGVQTEYEGAGDPCAELATVTVTFQPEMVILRNQLGQLPETALKIVIDNSISMTDREEVRRWIGNDPRYLLVQNEENVGLAAALNQGIRVASGHPARPKYLLMLDQDTEPGDGSVETLLAAYLERSKVDHSLGCVGPALVDVATGLEHGFHQACWYGWRRQFPDESSGPIIVSNINGSGTLVALEVFERVGDLDEHLFIDHVDTEWSFRVAASGLSLVGVPAVRFRQRMGETGKRIWLLGWRVWPYRSPARHFYLFRNTIQLIRMEYVPLRWKVPAIAKLALTFFGHALFDKDRSVQIDKMIEGARAGFAVRSTRD